MQREHFLAGDDLALALHNQDIADRTPLHVKGHRASVSTNEYVSEDMPRVFLLRFATNAAGDGC